MFLANGDENRCLTINLYSAHFPVSFEHLRYELNRKKSKFERYVC